MPGRWSLRTKFAVLLALLACAAGINAWTVWWTTGYADRELARPLASIQGVLGTLYRVKRELEAQSVGLGLASGDAGGPPMLPRADRASFDAACADMAQAVEGLAARSGDVVSAGVSTVRGLRERVEHVRTSGLAFLTATDAASREQTRADAANSIRALHELIERVEGRIIEDAGVAVGHGQGVQRSVLRLAVISMVPVALAGLLAALVFRRWILRPVGELRAGAGRFAAGQLAYRVPVGARDELGVLAVEFNDMAGRIEALHSERVERERLAAIGEMARRVVHNVRSPLSGIRALAEMSGTELAASAGSSPSHADANELREMQQRIVATVDRLDGWLEQLVRGSTPLEPQPRDVAVAPWLEQTLAPYAAPAGARSVKLDAMVNPANLTAWFDPLHVGQAVQALVANALEFAPPSSTVRIHVVREEGDQSGSVRVLIGDDGPGVPSELRARVFSAYFTTRPGGTGIGLAMVQSVARAHGGRCSVVEAAESGLGATGAVFELVLPGRVREPSASR